MVIPLNWYGFLGAKFEKPVNEGVPEVEGFEIAQAKTGFPVSVFRQDEDYRLFLLEGGVKKQNVTSAVRPSTFEAGWSLSSGQSPTIFNTRVLRKNLVLLKQKGEVKVEDSTFFGAIDIVLEELFKHGCGGFKELSEFEALFGTPDGNLGPLNMRSAAGACMKLGSSKQVAWENAPGTCVEMERDDYDAIINLDREVYAWISKTSLKDARLDNEKIADEKGRIFQAQAFPVSITGRRLIGGFIARFMEACKRGGFFGVIGFVLARGGWHELLGELTDGFDLERILKTYPGDVSKYDKGWLYIWHCVLVWMLTVLCADPVLGIRINRHYDRVLRSPTMLAILGLIILLTKGQPSGDIATIVFNTIVLVLQYCRAYCTIAPPNFWNARDCFQNMILKAGGDDSISTLSTQMRAWLGRGQRWEDLIRDTFAASGWVIILEEKALLDAEFMGYGSTLAGVDEEETIYTGLKFLPALPLNAVMAIDEWFKFKSDAGVPKELKDVSRYAAAFEKAFPHLWSRDEEAQEYVAIAEWWLARVRAKYWDDPCPDTRKAARGVPSLADLGELYFGRPIPQPFLNGKLEKIRERRRERGN